MQTAFIRASKYREIERNQSLPAALQTLMADVKSKGKLNIAVEPTHTVENLRVTAQVSDIFLASEGSNNKATLTGSGETTHDALANLLKNLLNPENAVTAPGDGEKARLRIGRGTQNYLLVKVEP